MKILQVSHNALRLCAGLYTQSVYFFVCLTVHIACVFLCVLDCTHSLCISLCA